MSRTAKEPYDREPKAGSGPAVGWLCAGFLLAGMGTVLLGPILPLLSSAWHLQDASAGFLLAAKFVGAFAGGASVPRRLRRGIAAGLGATCAGFAGFAFSGGPATGAATLFVSGYGLGLTIASVNILAGERYRARAGSALAAINFFWSLGGVATGVVVGAAVPRVGLRHFLLTFACLFAVVGLGGYFARWKGHSQEQGINEAGGVLPLRALLIFGAMLFFYGGLETSLTQWITTFTVRYAAGSKEIWTQSTIVALWSALTAGRALTSAVLRRVDELTLQRWALGASVLLIPALAASHGGRYLVVILVLLGFSLSPFFPTAFALLLRKRPSSRVAGLVLAVSGLGAAALSWAMGAVSTWTGSLRLAMMVPLLAAVCLLALSFGLRGEPRFPEGEHL